MTLALVLLWPASAHAAAATVKVTGCVPALDATARSATFEARMKAARGSERMLVRFTLQVRDEGIAMRWRKVVAPGFDQWLSSAARVRRYSYTRTIQNLSAPASYRTIVRFRWLDRDGDVLRGTRATSSACRQPDLRPNLLPLRVEVVDAAAGRYRVTVRNTGRTAADAYDLALGDATASVPALGPGVERVIHVTGPPCGDGLSATVDATGAVDERDEDDNELLIACST